MTPSEANDRALDLLGRADAAYATTLDQRGRPQTRAMFNLRNKVQFPGLSGFFATHSGRFAVFFTTNTSSPKVAELRSNPAVSVYYCAPKEFLGLMLGGDMEIVDDGATRNAIWQPEWSMYYPGGPDDPDHTVLRLIPSEAKLYCQFNFARLI
ncbi:MAG: pyridoxamine 5'-phosphate oxidase family protein [Deltaproteobacteria bacterium]|nr:pyridoxamine 5'-phosphate oxidase family protein [Deltaproteobacteria bacterium]